MPSQDGVHLPDCIQAFQDRLGRRSNPVLAQPLDVADPDRGLGQLMGVGVDLDTHQTAPQLALEIPGERALMAPMTAEQQLLRTFATMSVTAGPHLTTVQRDAFARAGCQSHAELQRLRSGAKVKAGSLVADGLRRPPTAKGTGFIRLEDADGLVDVIVPPEVYAECREAVRGLFVVVEGTLQRNGPVISVLAKRVSCLPQDEQQANSHRARTPQLVK